MSTPRRPRAHAGSGAFGEPSAPPTRGCLWKPAELLTVRGACPGAQAQLAHTGPAGGGSLGPGTQQGPARARFPPAFIRHPLLKKATSWKKQVFCPVILKIPKTKITWNEVGLEKYLHSLKGRDKGDPLCTPVLPPWCSRCPLKVDSRIPDPES